MKFSKLLWTSASLIILNVGIADVIYPGCPIPPQPDCICDVLPDVYNYGVMFGAVGCETKKIVFSGLIQTDYQFISVDDRVKDCRSD
jgi:hypothetical protein